LKVLVVGGGGREHALVWKLSQSSEVEKIYCAPGNGGIGQLAECIPIKATDVASLLKFAKDEEIDFTVVGPEAPLAEGIVDVFAKEGLKIFGPTKEGARIETSKVFAKTLMWKYGVPTAEGEVFDDPEVAKVYLTLADFPLVVKADGLAAGKGAIICETYEEAVEAVDLIMVQKKFGDAGNRIIIEECLEGEEASIIGITDGENFIPLVPSQDHKPVFDGDVGPNTGGMGAYTPAPVVNEKLQTKIFDQVLGPIIQGLKAEGISYRGVIYAGLMINGEDIWVLEFNARFGDPETQAILPLMESDLLPLLMAASEGDLSGVEVKWRDGAAVCVVIASGGYPGEYQKGKEIHGLEALGGEKDIIVFHAGTKRVDGKFITDGGRVLGVTAVGSDIRDAIERCYRAVEKIEFENMHYRRDIGQKALKRLGVE